MNKNLDHLTTDQIASLIERYYRNENVASLLTEYAIDVPASALFKLFPDQVLEARCPYCYLPLRQKHLSKTNESRMDFPYCAQCAHREVNDCQCPACVDMYRAISKSRQAERDLADQETRKFVFSELTAHQNSRPAVDLDSISFTHLVYLGALLRAGISEDYNIVYPIQTLTSPLAPTIPYQLEIASELYKNQIINIHPESDYSIFTLDESLFRQSAKGVCEIVEKFRGDSIPRLL